MNKYLDIAPEVAEALAAGKPVVALESTIISHGMPYPQNVETALKVEQIIRDAARSPRPSPSSADGSRRAFPRKRSTTSAAPARASRRLPAATCPCSSRRARTARAPSPPR